MDEHIDLPPEPQHSFVIWLFRSLGIRYTVFLPFIALLAFVLAIIAVSRFKTPVLTALLLAVVPLPFFYGAMSTIDGMMASMQVISISGAVVKPSELAEGSAMCFVSLQVGLVLMLPTYLLAVGALAYRAFTGSEASVSSPATEPRIGAINPGKV